MTTELNRKELLIAKLRHITRHGNPPAFHVYYDNNVTNARLYITDISYVFGLFGDERPFTERLSTDTYDSIMSCTGLDCDLYMMLTRTGMSIEAAMAVSLQYGT
jgi:hypothetical protein